MERRSFRAGWAVLSATLLAMFLRFFRIGVQSFWDDEVATFRAAALSLKQIWTDIPLIDANPPLVYTVLHFWRGFGETELGLRSMAAFFGVLAVPAAYLALRELIGKKRAVVAAFLFAINPLAVYCGQETRYNTMVTLFALLAVWAFVRVITEAKWRDAALLALCAALAIYSHYFAFFIMAALVVLLIMLAWRLRADVRGGTAILTRLSLMAFHSRSFVTQAYAMAVGSVFSDAARCHARGLIRALVGLLLAGLAFVPFLKFFTVQLLRGVHWREPLGIFEVLRRTAVYVFVGHSVTAEPTFISPLAGLAKSNPQLFSWLLLALVMPPVVLACFGLLRREAGRKTRTLQVLVLVPLAGVLLVSRLTPIFDPRYMLPFVPFALGALAVGLVDLWQGKRRWLAALAICWLLLLTVFSLKDYYYSPAHWRQDWRGLAEHVAAEAGPGDTVLFYNFYTSLAFLHYLEQQPEQPSVQYLYVLEERFQALDVKRRRLHLLLDGLAADQQRIWLVDYHGYMDDPYDDVRSGLQARGYQRISRRCWLPGLWRYCLERWSPNEDDLLASLLPEVDFARAEPSAYQLPKGWCPGEGARRWIGQRAQVRFRRLSGSVRVALRFFAPLNYLGGPLQVRVSVDDAEIGRIELTEEKIVDWRSKPFILPAGDDPVVLEIVPERAFVPDQVRHDGDVSPKSLLVEKVALEQTGE